MRRLSLRAQRSNLDEILTAIAEAVTLMIALATILAWWVVT